MKYLIMHGYNIQTNRIMSSGQFIVDGKKQELRRARRNGLTTARQQIKAAKLHRRLLKALAA